MIPRRIVSLVPSLTETLFDLGAGDCVVGITDFCIFPPDLDLPRVGGTKNPDVNAIRALQPDLVHMNFEENLKRHADAIVQFASVYVTEPKSVDDVEHLLTSLGELHDCAGPANAWVDQLRAARTVETEPFTFACAIWKNPWMWCGSDTYVSDLIATAGGVNVVTAPRYPAIPPEQVDAEVIFLPDEPYPFRADDAKQFGTRVIGPFPGHLFTWHGTRTVQGLHFLRQQLYGQ